MTISASGALAVELRPHDSTHWAATYYPMVQTPVGYWADVTWALHRCLMLTDQAPLQSTWWLEVRSSNPDHPCYANHQAWSEVLATGYATALAAYNAETPKVSLSLREAQRLRDAAVVVPAGQLSEWLLDDLKDETSGVRR